MFFPEGGGHHATCGPWVFAVKSFQSILLFPLQTLHLLWLQAWREVTAAMKQGKQVASLLWPGGESCWCAWPYQSVCKSVRLPVLLSVCPYCCVSACQSCQSVRTVVRVSAYLPARTVGCLFVCLPARLPVCLGLGLWMTSAMNGLLKSTA